MYRPLGDGAIGVVSFVVPSAPRLGFSGLPAAPRSITVAGLFQHLTTLDHPHLCRYVDFARLKNDRVVVVTETFDTFVSAHTDISLFPHIVLQTLSALAYLDSVAVTPILNLSESTMLLDAKGSVKLFNYGLAYMTEFGESIDFGVAAPLAMAPEVCLALQTCRDDAASRQAAQAMEAFDNNVPSPLRHLDSRADVWALGLVIVRRLLAHFGRADATASWLEVAAEGWLCEEDASLYDQLASELVEGDEAWPTAVDEEEQQLREQVCVGVDWLKDVARRCLVWSAARRLNAQELLAAVAPATDRGTSADDPVGFLFAAPHARRGGARWPSPSHLAAGRTDRWPPGVDQPWSVTDSGADWDPGSLGRRDDTQRLLRCRPLCDAYRLWCLAGGNLTAAATAGHLLRPKPPITGLPNYCYNEAGLLVFDKFPDGRSDVLDLRVVALSMDNVITALEQANLSTAAYFPLIYYDDCNGASSDPADTTDSRSSDTAQQPLLVKERDILYQCRRMFLMERLLHAYPLDKRRIWLEAKTDIPPVYRNLIWAALLDVPADYATIYERVAKTAPTASDHQIAVDVPRCHQYDELLCSPTAHRSFTRILKAWLKAHPGLVYWQGLDSLLAPFLRLNFTNEGMAYACLTRFIDKYLEGFFLKDNSLVLNEYLAIFAQLLAFHDPQLSTHLRDNEFFPDLYAMPWFLTMFAHVLPLHKIFHLWDTLLLGNQSLPWLIGIALIQQLRERLLEYSFNECILLFSDLPDIDIDNCVRTAVRLVCSTPKSCVQRFHSGTLTADSNDTSASAGLQRCKLAVEQLKAETCPRISGEEVLSLAQLDSATPAVGPGTKCKVLLIDIRPAPDFQRGCITGSVNIPYESMFDLEGRFHGEAAGSPAGGKRRLGGALRRGSAVATQGTRALEHLGVLELPANRGLVKVVIASLTNDRLVNFAVKFADGLCRLGVKKVCLLHNGIEAFRHLNILQVASTTAGRA